MEEHQVLTRLVPIERKIIITRIYPKYLLAGEANGGDYYKEQMLRSFISWCVRLV